MPSLLLLSVNARLLPVDRAGLTRMIAERRPDLAWVHGSPSLLRWRSISAALARNSGLVVVAGGRTSGGNLLLSSLGVDVLSTRELTFSDTRGARPPGAALAALRLRGSAFLVGAARLGSPAAPFARAAPAALAATHAAELQDAFDALVPDDQPAVLGIDTAGPPAPPDSQVLRAKPVAVAGVFVEGVFVDPRISVASVNRIAAGAVELELALPET
ncbi:MAG: hypothetical protein ACR2LX_10685 [Jatrophihabitans sp.]